MRHTDVAALAALLAVPAVYAQDMGEFTVGQIEVVGLQRISEGTVFNYLPVNIGDRMTPQKTAGGRARAGRDDRRRGGGGLGFEGSGGAGHGGILAGWRARRGPIGRKCRVRGARAAITRAHGPLSRVATQAGCRRSRRGGSGCGGAYRDRSDGRWGGR